MSRRFSFSVRGLQNPALVFYLVFGVSCGSLHAAVGNDENYTTGGGHWSWTPEQWTHTVSYANIRNYADRPDEETFKRVSVEWHNLRLDALGNFCTVGGQLRVTHGEKREKQNNPIDWFQGITVYGGTSPEATPDWSNGINEKDTFHATAVTSPSGRFEAHFDLRKSTYDRHRPQRFQFGLALAEHHIAAKYQMVVWSSRAPPIASSVQMLTIPAAPQLSRELALVNGASGWPFADPDGTKLIRAVNALQPLGKEPALAVLEQYIDLTKNPDYESEHEIVFWIIRVLFQPAQADEPVPRPAIAVFLDDRDVPEHLKWSLNPMAIQGDVPFMLGRQIGMGGQPEHPTSHIRWARLHGAVRERPLVPLLDPLAAGEAILQSPRFRSLEMFARQEAIRGIRSQSLAMVEGLIPPATDPDDVDDDQWRPLLKSAAEARLQWDAKLQRFVAGNKQ